MALLRILWRLLVMMFAFIMAAIAASLVAVAGFAAIQGYPAPHETVLETIGKIGLLGVIGASTVGMLAGPVALVTALVGEAFRLRSWLLYAFAGGLAGSVGMAMAGFETFDRNEMAAVLAAGLVGGLVYWLIAGRKAGFFRDTPG